MPEQIKGFIFDLDGVLVDTAQFHFIAWKHMANCLGFELSVEANEQLKGVSRVESMEFILGWGGIVLSEKDKKEWMEAKNRHYLYLVDALTPGDMLPGAFSFLEDSKAAGIGVGLGTASKNAGRILANLEITHMFDYIVDGTMTTRTKPDPQVFEMGARGLELAPASCVVFEDALKGIEAAITGGFYSVGIGEPDVLGRAQIVLPGLFETSVEELIDKLMNIQRKEILK